MVPRFNRPDRLYLAAALPILLAICIFAFRDWRAFRESTANIEVSRQILEANTEYLSAMKDAETGQRGYLLTGRDEYLAPLHDGIGEAGQNLDRLERMTAQRPALKGRASRLRTLTAEKLTELAKTVDVRRREGITEAMKLVATDRGKLAMDEIRRVAGEIEREEYARLVEDSRHFEQRGWWNRGAIALGTAGLFGLLLLATVRIMKATTQRDRVIGELDRANLSTAAARDLLELTLTSIGDAVITTDNRGCVTFLNAVAERLTGWSSAEAGGRPLAEVFVIVNEKTRKTVESPAARVLRDGMVVGLANHTLLVARDGSETPIDDSGAPIKDGDGRVIGVVLVFRDIRERAEAERRQRESEERLRLAAEAGEVGLWDWDIVADRVEWSEGVYRIHGMKPGEFGGTMADVRAGVYPADLEHVSASIARSLADQAPYEVEFRIVRRDNGAPRWISTTARVTYGDNGKPLRMMGAVKDITARKDAESAARLAADRLRVALANAGVVVFNQDLELRYTWIYSPGFPRPLTGLIGKTDYEIAPTAGAEELMQVKRGVLRTGNGARHEVEVHFDGRRYVLELTMEPLRGEKGEITGINGAALDITAAKQGELDQLRLNESLRRTNSDLQQFSYAASHDLKEPLRTISTYLELLQRRYRGRVLDGGADELIAFAVKGASRMAQLLDALLEYSRAGAEGSAPAGTVAVGVVVEDVLQALRRAVGETRAKVDVAPMPHVEADEVALRQLFQNLLANALKYRSDQAPRIRVWAEDGGGEWVFAVSDNGIGIDQRYQESIFGIFKRLHRDEYDGAGIGLATCKRIVENHGGRIWVESKLGEGATFRFALPKAKRQSGVGAA